MSKISRARDSVALVEVNERKADRKLKAEEKRQADLQRIRDMRSTTGIDPLRRFPKEIWMKILDGLDPEDKDNMWQLNPLFRDLLEKNRIRDILLPQILKVEEFQDSFSSYFPHEQHLRLICKSIRNCFDSLMEDEARKRIQELNADSAPNFEDILNPLLDYDEYDNDQRGPRKLKGLINNFTEGTNPGKCFYQRGLGVHFPEYGIENEKFWEHLHDIIKLLKAIGNQIWNFQFLMEKVKHESLEKLYLLFHEMICHMPNLKYLEVLIQPKMIDGARERKMKLKNIVKSVVSQSILQSHQFPHLIHLERLSLYSGRSGGFHNVYEAILEANQHIKMLDVSDWDKMIFPHYSPVVPLHLTRSLRLTSFAVNDENCVSASTWLRVNPILKRNWPLQKISMNLSSTPIFQLVQGLNQFPTLEKVHLNSLTRFSIGDTEKLGYLKLPNLVDFNVMLDEPNCIDYKSKNVRFFFSLQFLVHCKKLERLSWDFRGFNDMVLRSQLKKYEKENRGNVVDFRAGLRILYDSNIWNVFPSLDYVRVRIVKEGAHSACFHEYSRTDVIARKDLPFTELLEFHFCSEMGNLAPCVALVS